MATATLKWLTRCLSATCAMGALLVGELHAQDFSYTIINGTITITGYNGPGGDVTIPSMINGLPVTGLGERAFCYVTNATNVTIPNSVTSLGQEAFFCCFGLASITLGNGITRIEGGAPSGHFGTFENCTSLGRVTIPDNVTNISDGEMSLGAPLGAFFYCTSVTNVIIGKGLGYLGNGAFAWCTNLMGVYFLGDAPPHGSDSYGGGPFFASPLVTVYYLPGTQGWSSSYAGCPTMLWNPQVQTNDGSFGVRQNQFGFNIAGTPDIPLVVEATADLAATAWIPLQSCTLTNGLLYFNDPQWKNYSERFYRIRSP